MNGKKKSAEKKKQSANSSPAQSRASSSNLPQRVGSLEELEREVCQGAVVRVKHGGKVFEILVRRLSPAQSAKLEEVLDEARPPIREEADGKGGKTQTFDLSNLDYQAALRRKQVEARSLALWWCCDLFRAAYFTDNSAPVTEPDRPGIVAFVQSRLTESILEQLYQVARSLDVEMEALINFT